MTTPTTAHLIDPPETAAAWRRARIVAWVTLTAAAVLGVARGLSDDRANALVRLDPVTVVVLTLVGFVGWIVVRYAAHHDQGRRQTSFAAVQVWPVMDAPDVEINEADIRMEVFRASGAGGQHINKTSSAVRLIHEPTGLVAASQEERSQLQNREKAMNRLKAMVAAKIEEEHEAELAKIAGRQAQVGWGSQIRSYVVQPYQMVKDLRTEVETSQIDAVLDGDLDEFMEGYLRWRRREAE